MPGVSREGFREEEDVEKHPKTRMGYAGPTHPSPGSFTYTLKPPKSILVGHGPAALRGPLFRESQCHPHLLLFHSNGLSLLH